MESKMTCNVSDMWSPKLPKGLDFEISHHPLTMRRVVNLIVAMERFKGSSSTSVLSTEFTDENLLNIMLENLVEEKIVCMCESTPSSYQIVRTDEYTCSVTDSEKRSLVLVPNSMELHAVTLQGGADTTKVHLNMSTYLHPTSTVGRTVALAIKESPNLYLSCRKDGAEPTLHLEDMTADRLSSVSSDSDMMRFLFYKQTTGVNISTLMSVAFPNWYISTAVQNNKPVEMCLESANRHRTFNIRQI
ncbi:interleukin-1 beta-like [Etheostoma cragini]|uniref:interleukin-1 beta-like n=1 Tax=Etheostoma cragini TaxID=417921 RepID=UPI00155DE043|nr:interleukin-1 beta-like [Etheostoma cragini]XP_034727433.1 interleukin-1 beta-like [Etheostoma cragini]XP_034727434.1 interleukin-1 beta-like [Etheostoma cragini]